MRFYDDSLIVHTQLGPVTTLNWLPVVVVATSVPFSFTQPVFRLQTSSRQFQQRDAILNQASVLLMSLLKYLQMLRQCLNL